MPTTLITGCNTGIGLQTALKLASNGHHIIMLVRESEKSRAAYKEISSSSRNKSVHLIPTDLSNLNAVRKAIEEVKSSYDQLDLLINNAGVYSRNRVVTTEGFELTLAVNFLAPVLLAESLYPLMKSSEDPRIIHVTSTLYKNGKIPFDHWHLEGSFSGAKAYANSKMMILMHGLDLAERLKDSRICVNSLHPGVIATDIFREIPTFLRKPLLLFLKDAIKGSEPTLKLATDPDLKGLSGTYFHEKKEQKVLKYALQTNLRKRLMDQTNTWLHLDQAINE